MNHRKSIAWRAAVLAALLLTAGTGQGAGIPDHQTYAAIDVAVRESTLAGMRNQLDALSAGTQDYTALLAIDERTRQAVAEIYSFYGVSPGEHAAYGSRHQQAIDAWLQAHPSWQTRYGELQTEFDTLSSQLNAAR